MEAGVAAVVVAEEAVGGGGGCRTGGVTGVGEAVAPVPIAKAGMGASITAGLGEEVGVDR